MKILKKFSVISEDKTPLYVLALMIFFWTLFDATMTYLTPLILSENGLSNTMIGIIIATSSTAGAILDFLICKIFKKSTFKTIFFVMFIFCAAYPLMLWNAKSIWLYIFVMGIWGFYFDLYGFGTFDFIGKTVKKDEHSSGFGLIQVFRSLGLFIAPIIAGFFIADKINFKSLKIGWVFLVIGFLFFIILLFVTKKNILKEQEQHKKRRRNALFEAGLLAKLAREMMSPLIVTFFLFMVEAFFWTLAPLFAQNSLMKNYGGFFIAAYSLPPLLLGWFVGRITRKFGKKKTAIFGLLIGSAILCSISFLQNPIMIIIFTFFASCFLGIALPSINGAYADYISEASYVEGEIEALEDFSFNLGYIIGPLSAGIISDILGITSAFTVLGAAGFVVALILLKITPKKITIKA